MMVRSQQPLLHTAAAAAAAVLSPEWLLPFLDGRTGACSMERANGHADEGTPQHYGHEGSNISSSSGAGAVPLSSADDDESAGENMDAGFCSGQMVEPFNNNIAVFLDRTFRMIEIVPDDIVSWSEAGNSFIIKQVRRQCQAGKRR